MDEIVKDFLIESNENLDRLDQELVKLESDPASKDLLASVFRTIHTIKGSCGFLGFARLEKLAHAGESLLSRLRDGKITLSAEITSGLLAMVDAVRRMLAAIQATEQDGEEDYASLIEVLARLQGSQASPPAAAHGKVALNLSEPETAPREANAASVENDGPTAKATATPGKNFQTTEDSPEPTFNSTPDPTKIGGVLSQRGQVHPQDLAAALEQQEKGRHKIGEILVAQGATRAEDVLAAQQVVESRNPQASVETIRVGVTLLDRLMTLVGELVLARNQLLQLSNCTQDASLQTVCQRMNLIATELQGEVMKTRMQPIGNVWNKFPRTVRDLSLSCGKEVRLEMEGQDTELDRTIIEAIKDPLTHLVRNSMDHGIEGPEARLSAGKSATGVLKLRAFHEGGQVNIEIGDDGAGLNRERIRQKAIERGLITAEQAARMPDREIFNLIFLPGFSTAEKITNVSGRGVGMDVVKTNVEKIGGAVDVQSSPGRGTTVRVKIPLTLAIIPALVVTCGGDRYAIPQVSLLELVRLEAETARTAIEMVHGAPVYRLRGRLLPLVYLARELKLSAAAVTQKQEEDAAVNIVVLQADDRQFGLVVDQINDTEEIVVKPLRKQLKTVKTFAGSSIMGDGKVALILDVLGLAQRANVVGETRERALAEKPKEAGSGAEKQTFLLFAGLGDSRMAIPLSTLARLEEFPIDQVEMSGSQWVTQYRGHILPLIRLNVLMEERRHKLRALQGAPVPGSGPLQVLVLNHEGRAFGLVVDRILDIVEDRADMKSAATRPSVLYSVVIGERVTELLDIPAILKTAAVTSVPQTDDTRHAVQGAQ